MKRCPWATNELSIRYHDTEWGVPQRDERVLFEFLVLEGAQAGLSWDTILAKRENYREAFEGFDPNRIARFTPRKIESLLKNPGIVRNRLKVESTVRNAKAYLAFVKERGEGAFAEHLWSFVGGKPIVNAWHTRGQVPSRTAESDAMSKSLKKLGFNFVGSTICYAFMQAMGMVNDHMPDCPRHRAVQARALRRKK